MRFTRTLGAAAVAFDETTSRRISFNEVTEVRFAAFNLSQGLDASWPTVGEVQDNAA